MEGGEETGTWTSRLWECRATPPLGFAVEGKAPVMVNKIHEAQCNLDFQKIIRFCFSRSIFPCNNIGNIFTVSLKFQVKPSVVVHTHNPALMSGQGNPKFKDSLGFILRC